MTSEVTSPEEVASNTKHTRTIKLGLCQRLAEIGEQGFSVSQHEQVSHLMRLRHCVFAFGLHAHLRMRVEGEDVYATVVQPPTTSFKPDPALFAPRYLLVEAWSGTLFRRDGL